MSGWQCVIIKKINFVIHENFRGLLKIEEATIS